METRTAEAPATARFTITHPDYADPAVPFELMLGEQLVGYLHVTEDKAEAIAEALNAAAAAKVKFDAAGYEVPVDIVPSLEGRQLVRDAKQRIIATCHSKPAAELVAAALAQAFAEVRP